VSNQVVRGQTKCSGAVLRVRPNGKDLQLVAWGFRNPFGLGFGLDGQLYATENGFDERGSRPVWGAPDVMWNVQPGLWYGWPDFSGGEPISAERFNRPASRPKFCSPSTQTPRPNRLSIWSARLGERLCFLES